MYFQIFHKLPVSLLMDSINITISSFANLAFWGFLLGTVVWCNKGQNDGKKKLKKDSEKVGALMWTDLMLIAPVDPMPRMYN